MKKLRILYGLCLALIIVGCERGCTIENVLDRESKDIQLNGETITIEAKVVDYRNSRAINRNIFHREVTHTYGINIDVRYRGQLVEDVYFEGVDDPETVDLDKVLKRVSVALSKDGNHLAVGMDQTIAEVLHFYKDYPIRNLATFALNPTEGTPWSKLKIDSYPSPRELILNSLREDCVYFADDENLVYTFMNDVNPSDTAHRLLLSYWPQCEVAMEYYTGKNVQRLSVNKTWKKWAEARGIVALRENIQPATFDGTDEFLSALNSPEIRNMQDSAIIEGWGGKGDQKLNELLIERLKGPRSNFSTEKRRIVYNQAKMGLSEFQREGDSDYQREAMYCLRVLDAMGDTTEADRIIHNTLSNIDKFNNFDLIEVVFENYELYTPAQQRFIRSRADEVMEEIEDYARSTLFRAAEGILDCKHLKSWKKNYAKDLEFESPPKGC